MLASGGHDFDVLLWPLDARIADVNHSDGRPHRIRPSARIDAHRGHVNSLRFTLGTIARAASPFA